MHSSPRSSYRCSKTHLCRHTQSNGHQYEFTFPAALNVITNELKGEIDTSIFDVFRGHSRHRLVFYSSSLLALLIIFGIMVYLYMMSKMKFENDAASSKLSSNEISNPIALSGGSGEVKEEMEEIEKDSDILLKSVGTPFMFLDINVNAGNKSLISNISGHLNPGEVLTILGPSGSGKTVLLDVLAGKRLRGTATWDSGSLYLGNEEVTKCINPAFLNYVSLKDTLSNQLTVKETLEYIGHLSKPVEFTPYQVIDRVEHVLKLLGMMKIADRKVGLLSQGQRARVRIGTSLVFPPSILILDEPLSGLDSVAATYIVKAIKHAANIMRFSVIFTLHMPSKDLAKELGNILLIDSGKQIFFGSLKELQEVMDHTGLVGDDAIDTILHLVDSDFSGTKCPENVMEAMQLQMEKSLKKVKDISTSTTKNVFGTHSSNRSSSKRSVKSRNSIFSHDGKIMILSELPRRSVIAFDNILNLFYIQ